MLSDAIGAERCTLLLARDCINPLRTAHLV